MSLEDGAVLAIEVPDDLLSAAGGWNHTVKTHRQERTNVEDSNCDLDAGN